MAQKTQAEIDAHEEEFLRDNNELVEIFRKFCKKYDKHLQGFTIQKNKPGYWELLTILDMNVLIPE